MLHFVVLVVVMLFPATVPEPGLAPVHVVDAAADVFGVDFLLFWALPEVERPGAAKVTVCAPPEHVVELPAAKAFPLVATCAMPNESTGTELKAMTDMNFRSTCSLPLVWMLFRS